MRRTLNGEGRVEIGGEDTNLLLHVGTKFAGPKAFNELHSRWKELCVPAGGSETDGSGFGNNGNKDWECTGGDGEDSATASIEPLASLIRLSIISSLQRGRRRKVCSEGREGKGAGSRARGLIDNPFQWPV